MIWSLKAVRKKASKLVFNKFIIRKPEHNTLEKFFFSFSFPKILRLVVSMILSETFFTEISY